jgi:arylsulfatase
VDELGGPTVHNNYPWGWTMAGNTPFKRWKREVHEGGVADPCILSWPRRVAARGEIRHRFAHAIDVLPTILELTGVPAPREIAGVAQTPIEGTSFAYLLDDANAKGCHETQYFEMFGSRAVVHEGWKAVTFKPIGLMYDDGLDPDAPFEDDVWELYHVAEDFSECHDLADKDPEKLAELKGVWGEEARKYQVLPLDNRPAAALFSLRRTYGDRGRHVLWPYGGSVPERVAPNVRNRPHAMVAEVDVAEGVGIEGVLLAMGTGLGGWSFHVVEGRLRYVHSYLGKERSVVGSETVVPPGAHLLGFEFRTDGDSKGEGRLTVDGNEVGRGPIGPTVPIRYSITGAGLTCGWELGPQVGDGYQAPFRFNAGLRRVVLTIGGEPHRDAEAELGAILSEQ